MHTEVIHLARCDCDCGMRYYDIIFRQPEGFLSRVREGMSYSNIAIVGLPVTVHVRKLCSNMS